ncbi:MAG: hypothetical protein Q7R41_17665 [Phycisphaerales bacterium]|nr:hypothetical protein [Phycisphaerales bacterium]
MRKLRTLVLAMLLGMASTGCIMVIDGGLHSARVGKHKRIVEIDDELYVIDMDKHTATKLNSDESSTSVTKIEAGTETHNK